MAVRITTDESIKEAFKLTPKKRLRMKGVLVAIVITLVCFFFRSEIVQLHRLETSSTKSAKTLLTSRDPQNSNDTSMMAEVNDTIVSPKATGNATKIEIAALDKEANATIARVDDDNDNNNDNDNGNRYHNQNTTNASVGTNRNKTRTSRNYNTTTTTNSSSSSEPPILTLLVMLSGEFGNNLLKIIRGWGIAKLAQQEFGLTTRIVFAQQHNKYFSAISKAKQTTRFVKKCFLSPSFNTTDFELGNRLLNESYFHELIIPGVKFSLSDGKSTIEDIKKNLKIISDYLGDHPEMVTKENNAIRNQSRNQSIVPRLMVTVNSLIINSIVNEFYDAFRKNFVFDNEKCCGNTLKYPPGVNETVLHYRNFQTEMKESTRDRLGFRNLNVSRISSEVLGHLKEGDKIAIAGRNLESNSKKKDTEAYGLVSVLTAKNLTVRFAPGPDAMADFCFLTHARKELIGTSKSTYLQLAAFMGGPSMKLARMYQYVTPVVVKRGSDFDIFRTTVGSNWTHPELRARIQFEQYF